jgi:polyisoprenoid-binding protein YceI
MANDLGPSSVDIASPVLSFNSDNGTRDAQMAEALEYRVYPNVSFVSTKIASERYVRDNHHARSVWTIDGRLTFHGVTKNVCVPVSVILDGKKLVATGVFELKLTDFDIELPSLLLLPVENWIKVTFCIMAETSNMPELSEL